MSNQTIQMPDGVQVDLQQGNRGRFVMTPLERGYGVTIGNSLRRVLLSSLQGIAVTAIKIDGVQHEFSTITGVTEDVSDIILNLKGIRLKSRELGDGDVSMVLRGPGTWTGKDIADATNDYEVLNPDHHVATLADDAELVIDLRIGKGRGYVSADDNKRADDPIGVIAIDAIFTPIVNVKYTITPTRVGQRVDFEKLELDVTSDGSIAPEDALAEAAQILRDHIALFISMDAEPQKPEERKEVDAEVQRIRELLSQSVDELDLDEGEMLKFRNFGRKSLQELIEVLEERGLFFGMDVDKYLQES